MGRGGAEGFVFFLPTCIRTCTDPYDVACVWGSVQDGWAVLQGIPKCSWPWMKKKKMNELEKERPERWLEGMLNSLSAFCSTGGACCMPQGRGELLAFQFCQWWRSVILIRQDTKCVLGLWARAHAKLLQVKALLNEAWEKARCWNPFQGEFNVSSHFALYRWTNYSLIC